MNNKVRGLNVVNAIFLTILAFMTFYPFLQTLLTSFASYEDVLNAKFIVIPWHFNFDSYKEIFESGVILRPYITSMIITIVSTALQLFLTSLGAYVLASKTLPFKRALNGFIIFTMFFGGGLIAFVLLLKSLHLLNSYFGLIIPFAVNAFYLILLKNYMRRLPDSVFEAARLDGASEFRIFIKIALPLCIPALMTIGLYYFVGSWNDWYWPMIIIEDPEKYTLAYVLRYLIMNSSSDLQINGHVNPTYLNSRTKEAATVIVSIIPMIVVFPIVQKYFVKGITLGAVKD